MDHNEVFFQRKNELVKREKELIKKMELKERKKEWSRGYAAIEDLAEIRKWRGFSQKGLAKRLGIAKETISRLETGKRLPGIEMARRLGGLLGVHFY